MLIPFYLLSLFCAGAAMCDTLMNFWALSWRPCAKHSSVGGSSQSLASRSWGWTSCRKHLSTHGINFSNVLDPLTVNTPETICCWIQPPKLKWRSVKRPPCMVHPRITHWINRSVYRDLKHLVREGDFSCAGRSWDRGPWTDQTPDWTSTPSNDKSNDLQKRSVMVMITKVHPDLRWFLNTFEYQDCMPSYSSHVGSLLLLAKHERSLKDDWKGQQWQQWSAQTAQNGGK